MFNTIQQFFQTHKQAITILAVFSVLYFAIRLLSVMNLPIFTDEAIYIRWAQIANNDSAQRFISLTDGKQPMFVWLTMIVMRLLNNSFLNDPLLAGRFVSVFAGFFTMIGLYFISNTLFRNKTIGLITSGMYAIYPFALVYDRMALYDSLVGMFVIWSFYLEILLIRYIRLDLALILALVVGGAMLTKANAFASIYLLPTMLLLFDFSKKEKIARIARFGMYAIIAAVLSYLYYSILRLSPHFHIIDEKTASFAFPLHEWFTYKSEALFNLFTGNLKGLLSWVYAYLTLPWILLFFYAYFKKEYYREKILLFLWFATPFIYFAIFGKVIYPRHIFFMTLLLLPIIALAFSTLIAKTRKKWVTGLLIAMFTLFPLYADYHILANFSQAPIPQSDRDQYSNEWPSGVGVKEALEFFRERSKNEKIYVGTEGTFGLLPYAFEIYEWDNPNMIIKGFWPINNEIQEDLLIAAKKMPTYVVFYQPCPACKATGLAPDSWPVKQILQVNKYNKGVSFTVYQVYVR